MTRATWAGKTWHILSGSNEGRMRLTYEDIAQTIIDYACGKYDKTPAELVQDLVTLVRADAAAEEREACAKAMCSDCAAGKQAHHDDEGFYFHFYAHGPKYLCAANDIRQRGNVSASDQNTSK